MLFFLYGADNYRSRKKLKEIIESYKKVHKSGLNLKYFGNDDNLNFQDFQDEARQSSMFKEKKLIVLEGVFADSDFKKEFLKKGKAFIDSEDIIIFYEEKEISKKDSLLVFLKKHAKCQDFESLTSQQLKRWVKKELKELGAVINNEALDTLVMFVDNNLWRMANEIKKLASFKDGKEIDLKDVKLLVKPKIEPAIFKTIDAIASKDKKRALRLIKEHLEKGDSPFYLFSMINFQFRNLLIVKDLLEKNLSPFNLSDLHPFVVQKSSFLARKFNISELKKIYQKIFEIDLGIKTGKIESGAALELLITGI
jgi:DNA polymerase-3 subunit delta